MVPPSNNFPKMVLFEGEKVWEIKGKNTFNSLEHFVLKYFRILVKFGHKLAKFWSFFLAISRAAFLARNVSQNHFSFSREMREMCRSSIYIMYFDFPVQFSIFLAKCAMSILEIIKVGDTVLTHFPHDCFGYYII